jgi:hypothetical protein
MGKYVLVAGGKVKFIPSADWQWFGWDGTVTVTSASHVLIDGRNVVRKDDLEGLGSQLTGKPYVAVRAGVPDTVPGSVSLASVSVRQDTLSSQMGAGGSSVARESTQGTFALVCFPSLAGQVPDPVAASHSGTWSVIDAGQEHVKAE